MTGERARAQRDGWQDGSDARGEGKASETRPDLKEEE